MQTRTAAGPRGDALEFLIRLPSMVRLYWRLLCDARVSVWPKALLVGALAYVIMPFDLIPDLLPLIGQVDDVAIVLLAARWFVRWCPAPVVLEHASAIGGGRGW
jgi:uncharacterized membrane protein YkvA (DUF1232 family)